MTDWGTPDWADEKAYPRKLSLREWWWEFTRRRPDYRALWLKWGPVNEAHVYRNQSEYEEMAANQGDTIELFLDHAATDDPDWLRVNFNVSTLLNPKKSFGDWELFQHYYPTSGVIDGAKQSTAYENARRLLEVDGRIMLEHLEQVAMHKEDVEGDDLVRYVFDLAKPLGPQIKHAEQFLLQLQVEAHGRQGTRKPNIQNWPDYLRVLDGRNAGASHREVGMNLWPRATDPKKRAVDAEKAAKRVRDNFPI